MMYKNVIDEIIDRKTKEYKLYQEHYRQTKSLTQLEAAEHVERCLKSLKRLRKVAPTAHRNLAPEYADVFMPRDNPTMEELLASYAGNVPRIG